MNKKISLGLAISIAALVAAVTFIMTSFFSLQRFNSKVQAVKEKAEKYERLEALDTYVREHFYTDLDEESLMNGLLKGYVEGLDDPYSTYLTAEEYQAVIERGSGTTIGIGVTANESDEGYIHLIEISKNSPAEEAGLLPEDLIVAVDGTDVLEVGFETAIDLVKGEEGTTVTITVRRDGRDSDYTVTRRPFDLITATGELLDGNIGYIYISNFRENTVEQYEAIMEELLANGAEALIFDVRGNGGGLLGPLEEMLDPLLPEGVIATATYQDGTTENVVHSDAEELMLPMAVLVNGNSASAAELFSASLRDFGKAQLVGETTFGKGVMQTTTQLEDGGGLTLTVATYQTVKSDCYQGVGLTPDVEVPAGEDFTIGDPDPAADPQLAAAIALFD